MRKPLVILLTLAVIAGCQKPEVPAGNDGQTPETTTQQPDESGKQDQPVSPDHPDQPDQPREGDYYLRVIETTDIHGHIVEIENNTTHYRLSYIYKKSYASLLPTQCRLLLDGGDLYQGASISNLLNGWPIYTAMDMMGYDAVALGNHEFDWGWETLGNQDATLPDYTWNGTFYQNKVPVVCANIYQYGSRIASTKDYVIVEKEAINSWEEGVKVKIGIVGFAVNYAGSIMESKFIGKGYSVKEDYTMAEELAANLESTGECDATILLVHGSAPSVAARLSQASAIDLVLGGHSHRYENGRADNGIPYLQGGRYAERYAAASMQFYVDKSGQLSFQDIVAPEIVQVDAARDYIADYLDPGIKEVSDVAIDQISEELGTVIGHINVSATTYALNDSGGRASTMGNWMCDVTRSIGEADVAFVNAGGIRTTFPLNGAPTRDITVANVYEMFPFDNTIYIYNISYADLLQLLQYSLTAGGEALMSRMTGIDCYYTSQGAVKSLVKDGTTIYSNGSWAGGWASKTLTLALGEYLATTERTDYYTHLPNPLIEWNNTSRLINNEMVDNESAVRVLKAEAASSGGLLAIDTKPHYILAD